MTLADDIFDYKLKIENDLKCRYPDGIDIKARAYLADLFSKMNEVIDYLTEEGY